MEQDVKVFSSKITRGLKGGKNNLYELLETEPAKPIRLNETPNRYCTFQPRTDKYYEYKKKSKLKVKCVRDIRNSFENDISIYLPLSLEKQRNILLKRIKDGCSKDEDTKKMALNILKSDNPISRTAWQMLTNINPEEHTYPMQYYLWNGKHIRVCGSRGGPDRYICKYELRKGRELSKNKKSIKKNIVNKKKYLLQNSLSIKIKPGPLTQKKYIDDSYQKYHVGNIELVSLPKPGLDVMPGYGPMEPTMRNFVNSLRDINGMISQKWAEFAVSMLGTVKNSNVVQLQPNACTTFDLSYKYGQKKMLMRRDIGNVTEISSDKLGLIKKSMVKEDDIAAEVTQILCDIIDSVEISFNQDTMYTGEDEERNTVDGDCSSVNINNNCAKEKNKKKFGELDRLHVTVIRLPETAEKIEPEPKICKNSYCLLGCICKSLNCAVVLKGHCGRVECMFQCKCDYSSLKELDNYDSVCADLMPGLLKLDNEMNLKLAKEEKKFHQTVVLSGDKSILLKPQRRSWKASSKYSDFYKTMSFKTNKKIERDLIVVDTKIVCDNIEPWCMVHNLYKCFCKGRFVNNAGETQFQYLEMSKGAASECDKITKSELNINSNQRNMQTRVQREQTLSTELKRKERRKSDKPESCSVVIDLDDPKYAENRNTSARTQQYVGRKYNKLFYSNMNNKIREMEKDDQSLLKKLNNFIKIDKVNVNKTSKNTAITSDKEISSRKERYSFRKREIEKNDVNLLSKRPKKNVSSEDSFEENNIFKELASEENEPMAREDTPELSADHIRKNILSGGFETSDIEESNKSKLAAWLVYSYKQYKQRCQGITKLTLQAPQPKKMVLLPWNFILERYKERKNLFLVTKQKPFRMYMAVNRDHPFLQDCINIDDIRFADLYIYPITVKKLLTNASDLKNSFCILCGHAYCWEFIGFVNKVDEPKNEDNLKCDTSLSNDKSFEYNENSCTESESKISTEEEEESVFKVSQTSTEKNTFQLESSIRLSETNTEKNTLQSESSKWFVMTIENDFSEIQFFNRGFFVKYDSIIKAINIARYSLKTVRLSSQKCADNNSNSQFGIYAIPNSNEDCVFIGPYECNEPLGIETIKSVTFTRQLKRTRGYWIATNKVDNIKVIESPMSFMPTNDAKPKEILSLGSNPNEKKDSFSFIDHITEDSDETQSSSSNMDKSKLVKPIKILKSNSFFPLNPNSLLRLPINIQRQESNNSKEKTTVSLTDLLSKLNTKTSQKAHESDVTKKNSPLTLSQPQVDSDSKEDENINGRKNEDTKTEGSMFAILKPEEINKRIMDTKIISNTDNLFCSNNEENIENTNSSDSVIETDIENFLSYSLSPVQDSNVFVISDDEEESSNINSLDVIDIYIECKNIKNLGWIPGKRKLFDENRLSFQFPGFNYTEFYPDSIAFDKIEQVLSRKICVPANRKLYWRVVTNKDELKSCKKLQSSDLGSDLVLTSLGPRRKLDLLKALSFVKTYSRKPKAGETATVSKKVENAVPELEQIDHQTKKNDLVGD